MTPSTARSEIMNFLNHPSVITALRNIDDEAWDALMTWLVSIRSSPPVPAHDYGGGHAVNCFPPASVVAATACSRGASRGLGFVPVHHFPGSHRIASAPSQSHGCAHPLPDAPPPSTLAQPTFPYHARSQSGQIPGHSVTSHSGGPARVDAGSLSVAVPARSPGVAYAVPGPASSACSVTASRPPYPATAFVSTAGVLDSLSSYNAPSTYNRPSPSYASSHRHVPSHHPTYPAPHHDASNTVPRSRAPVATCFSSHAVPLSLRRTPGAGVRDLPNSLQPAPVIGSAITPLRRTPGAGVRDRPESLSPAPSPLARPPTAASSRSQKANPTSNYFPFTYHIPFRPLAASVGSTSTQQDIRAERPLSPVDSQADVEPTGVDGSGASPHVNDLTAYPVYDDTTSEDTSSESSDVRQASCSDESGGRLEQRNNLRINDPKGNASQQDEQLSDEIIEKLPIAVKSPYDTPPSGDEGAGYASSSYEGEQLAKLQQRFEQLADAVQRQAEQLTAFQRVLEKSSTKVSQLVHSGDLLHDRVQSLGIGGLEVDEGQAA
ncbi:hypothetical protein EXIGLDRAFT_845932 [Exidia glandulosa HHB12029]|uniref:Uncharacterized protein n=1 Tax=Exidia glandulosa HHB12029 TaxID=1314781 RepID=A0A165Z760_EXIGL|nr:hypothetical protein EXIGLDRAFT_845932 [Exidia glandulosa HHB12029]